MINHENGHSRPLYLAIKDKDILWFIPIKTKVEKYKSIIEKKVKKYGTCKTILIKKITEREQVFLIQNAFPTIEKYVKNKHRIEGRYIRISKYIEKEILDEFQYMLSLKKDRLNLFFPDIDKIKEIMLEELNKK